MADSPSKRYYNAAAFKDTKVETCRQVAVQKGHNVAVPFFNTSARQEQPKLTERKSVSHEVHMVRNTLHAGMEHKPLQRYSPLAERSRLRSNDFIVPYKNSSSIVIGDRRTKDKKQFLTMARIMLKRPSLPVTTNPGIISDQNRWRKYKEWH